MTSPKKESSQPRRITSPKKESSQNDKLPIGKFVHASKVLLSKEMLRDYMLIICQKPQLDGSLKWPHEPRTATQRRTNHQAPEVISKGT
jgi:hypothetical protein